MVYRVRDIPRTALHTLLDKYSLRLHWVDAAKPIPGSFWGETEAGLIGDGVYVRHDTPVHSLLHETCHYVCMDDRRRRGLHTDAAGDYAEENAVCYLQILLADHLPGTDRFRQMQDMDAWGYSFRLGSARDWFERDAEDAKDWLRRFELIDTQEQPTWQLRC